MSREQAEIGIFVTLQQPTRDMIKEAAGKGLFRSKTFHRDYPTLQIFTIDDLLSGKLPNLPYQVQAYKKAGTVHLSEKMSFNFDTNESTTPKIKPPQKRKK